MNGFHDTKWKCSHLTCASACQAENGSHPHSVRLCLGFHPLNAKGDIDAEPPPMIVDMSASMWIEKAQLPR